MIAVTLARNEFLCKSTPTCNIGKWLLLRAQTFFIVSTLVKGPATLWLPLQLLPLLLANQQPSWQLPQAFPS